MRPRPTLKSLGTEAGRKDRSPCARSGGALSSIDREDTPVACAEGRRLEGRPDFGCETSGSRPRLSPELLTSRQLPSELKDGQREGEQDPPLPGSRAPQALTVSQFAASVMRRGPSRCGE